MPLISLNWIKKQLAQMKMNAIAVRDTSFRLPKKTALMK